MNRIASRNFLNLLMLTFSFFINVIADNTFVSTDYEVRDLRRTDNCFKLDAKEWFLTKPMGQQAYTTCGTGYYILAGDDVLGNPNNFGSYMSRTYSGIESHTWVYFSLSMTAIDRWQSSATAHFLIEIDGTTVFTSWSNWAENDFSDNYCGSGGHDDLRDIHIAGRFSHNGGSIAFKVICQLDQSSNQKAMGIRDLNLLFATPTTTPTQAMCGKGTTASGNNVAITGGLECPCLPNQYKNAGGTCVSCPGACTSCFGGTASDCYACAPGYGFNGVSCIACHDYCDSCWGTDRIECGSCKSGYLLYANTTCLKQKECASPLEQTGCDDDEYCESPCADPNDYLYWDGDCQPTCPFPLQSPPGGFVKLCTYPCNSGEYLYWDGTCSAVCDDPPLTRDSIKGKDFCLYDCSATPVRYLYWDGTCSANCDPPLVPGTLGGSLFCFYPCATTGEHLYWDGSCKTSCSSPLTPRTTQIRQFCDYPCTTGYRTWYGSCVASCDYPYIKRITQGENFCDYPCTGTQFLYWDNLCYSSCNPPFTQSSVGGKKYCNFACSGTQFLYWDNQCRSSCDAPLVQAFIGTANICEYPCATGESLYANGTCKDSCPAPYTTRITLTKTYCDPICPTGQALFWDGSCISSCSSPLRYATNSSGTYCVTPCNNPSYFYNKETDECSDHCATTIVFEDGLYLRCIDALELVKLLHHIRYLDVKRPPKMQTISVSKYMNVLSPRIISGMFTRAKDWLLLTTAQLSFENYIFQSSFLLNFIDELILLGIILILGIVFELFEFFAKTLRWFYPQIIFERLSILAKWNLFLVLVTSSAGDIIFYSALEFKTFESNSIQANLSLIICVIMLTGFIILLIFNFYLLHRIQDFKVQNMLKKNNITYPDFLQKYQTCQVLFRGLNDEKYLSLGFYLLYEARIAAPMLIAYALSETPIVQSSFYVAISIFILLFIYFVKPIKKKLDYLNLLLLEIIILVANLSAMGLAICEVRNADLYGGHLFFGDAIEICNSCINILACVFLALKMISGIKSAMHVRKNYPSEEIGAWTQLIFIPLQQGGLGFEQVQIVSSFTVSRIKSHLAKVHPQPVEEEDNVMKISLSQEKLQPNFTALNASNIPILEMPEEVIPTPELSVAESKTYKISEFKKRKYNNINNSSTSTPVESSHVSPVIDRIQLKPMQTIETIEEFGLEDDNTLTGRLNRVSNNSPGAFRNRELMPIQDVIHEPSLERNMITPSGVKVSDSLAETMR